MSVLIQRLLRDGAKVYTVYYYICVLILLYVCPHTMTHQPQLRSVFLASFVSFFKSVYHKMWCMIRSIISCGRVV